MRLEFFILGLAVLNLAVVLDVVRRRRMHEHFAILWMLLGFGGLLLAALRPAVDRLSNLLGITYGTSLVFTVGIFFLLVFCMYLTVRVSKLETQIELLAEHVAVLESQPFQRTRSEATTVELPDASSPVELPAVELPSSELPADEAAGG